MLNSVIDAIGNTPLIRLKRASEETGCEILGKAEFMNPGQSVKDRAGLFIIRDAEAKGLLKPGGVIVEGTAGNTGIGLTLVAKALGYRTVIVIPDTQSQEKKDTLRLIGAELIEVPAVPYKNPNNYVKVSGRLAEQLAKSEPNGAIWANQFDNVANRDGHVRTTAEEIWHQTGGKVDGFVSAVGTGGTLAGVAIGLKARNPDVKIALADPLGAALYSFYTEGELKAEGNSITEGIGQGRITANLEGFAPDFSWQVTDEEALPIVFDLVEEEGPVPRRLDRHQHRRRHPAGAGARTRPHHRDGPVRLRHALSVEAVQPGVPALQEPAGAGLAGARARHRRALREGGVMAETEALFRDDAYLRDAEATVVRINDRGGIVLDRTIFYATSGGQPGDTGFLERADGTQIAIAGTITGESKEEIIHIPAAGAALPEAGEALRLPIDWERRYRLMRMHTACHLLTVALPVSDHRRGGRPRTIRASTSTFRKPASPRRT